MLFSPNDPEAANLIISLIREGMSSIQAFNILNSVYDYLSDRRFYSKTRILKPSTVLEWDLGIEEKKDKMNYLNPSLVIWNCITNGVDTFDAHNILCSAYEYLTNKEFYKRNRESNKSSVEEWGGFSE